MFLVLDFTLIDTDDIHTAIMISDNTVVMYIEEGTTLSFISSNELKSQIHFDTPTECYRAYHFALISIEAECHGAHDAKHVYNFIEGNSES